MSKKEINKTGETKQVETKIEAVQVETKEAPKFNKQYARKAYSLIENEGKYHVISVEFDHTTLLAGEVKKIESNTNKFLMQERLQVLLMGDDLI